MSNINTAVPRFHSRDNEDVSTSSGTGIIGMNITSKKNDDSTIATSEQYHYRLGLAKKICVTYLLYPAVILFASIGIFSVVEDIREVYSYDGMKVNNNAAMETRDTDSDLFDGHIRTDQTKGHGKIREFIGREKPFGDSGEPIIYRLLNDVVDAHDISNEDHSVPFYWEVGFTGHSSIESKLCKCLGINIASSAGQNHAGNPNMLEPLVPAAEENLCKVYNVDLGTHKGVQRARELGLMKDVIPHFISSPFLPEITSLFSEKSKGRLFVSIPSTEARVKSSYRHLHSKKLFDGSYLEFVSSDNILANNYLVHMLSGKWGGVQELTEDDVLTAHKVLKEKFIVFRWSDTQKLAEYLLKGESWDLQSMECMFPPKLLKEEAEILDKRIHGPKKEKPPEDLAAEEAFAVHNVWDRKLYTMLTEEGFA